MADGKIFVLPPDNKQTDLHAPAPSDHIIPASPIPISTALKNGFEFGDWRLTLKGSPGAGRIERNALGLVTLTWPETVSRLRLEKPIDPSLYRALDQEYKFKITLSFPSDQISSQCIEWMAILTSSDAADPGFRFLTRLEMVEKRSNDNHTIEASTFFNFLDINRRYQFCIQMKKHGRKCSFNAVAASVEPTSKLVNSDITTSRASATKHCAPAQHIPDEHFIVADNEWSDVFFGPQRDGATASAEGRPRKKAVVIAWDMGHDPAGRAYLLADMLSEEYDVELIGPLFERYGKHIWAPIRNGSVRGRAFRAACTADFVRSAVNFVTNIKPDVVIACKARLPSMLLSQLIKHRVGCRVLLDVDEHELSFFENREPLSLSDVATNQSNFSDLDEPYGQTWTRLCESLISTFDGLIVSNTSLQDRFGGVVIRHARDEKVFFQNLEARRKVRAEFGFSETDRVILFLGTPHQQDGVFRIAEALNKIANPSLVLCVIGGSNDKQIDEMFSDFSNTRIKIFPDQPQERFPELINLADGVCLLQNPESALAKYQVPAMLSDALSIGIPVAVRKVESFIDISAPHVVTHVETDQDLHDFLMAIASDKIGGRNYQARIRQYFIGEMSYAVNRARLNAIISATYAAAPSWTWPWTGLMLLLSELWTVDLPTQRPSWLEALTFFPAIKKQGQFNVAFFWKQNDTGLYGRRHDMILKYLTQHPRVGKIVQFDAPVTPRDIAVRVRLDADARLDQGNLVANNIISRFMKIADSPSVARRVFVHRGGHPKDRFLGQELLSLEQDYPEWVKRAIEETIGRKMPVLSWVTPIARGYPKVHDYLDFSFTVADLIDDQRAMAPLDSRNQVHASYSEFIQRADVVLANCNNLADSFSTFGRAINVIPNAAEPTRRLADEGRPDELNALHGPIVGYVGNLRDRIDVELIGMMAHSHPEWNIVLIGSAHGKPDVLSLREFSNVRFLGVKPYEMVLAYIRAFDVAIMPHLDNEISRSMNPLKLYVYLSAGTPIVSTDVQNIGDVAPFLKIAKDRDDFVIQVARLIGARDKHTMPDVPYSLTWDRRIDDIFKLIDNCIL